MHSYRVENSNDGGRLLRTLKVEHRRIYAPDCNIGNVRYEENGMYINVPDHKVGKTTGYGKIDAGFYVFRLVSQKMRI